MCGCTHIERGVVTGLRVRMLAMHARQHNRVRVCGQSCQQAVRNCNTSLMTSAESLLDEASIKAKQLFSTLDKNN